MFSYFRTRSLTSYEIENCREYDVIYFSPDVASWNPTNPICVNQEMEYIDHQGEVKLILCDHSNNSMIFDPMELIEVSTAKVVAITCDIYEAATDATI